MNNQTSAAIEEHVFTQDLRQPFEQCRRPGPLLLYGVGRPSEAWLRSLLARDFMVVFADLQDARWRENNLMFCYQLARCLVDGLRQVDADAHPIAPEPALFAGRPFSTLSLTLDEIEQDAQRRKRYVYLILNDYDQLDEGLQTGRLSVEILNQLRHIIQHREYIAVLLSGSRPPRELAGAAWTDYLINVRMMEAGG